MLSSPKGWPSGKNGVVAQKSKSCIGTYTFVVVKDGALLWHDDHVAELIKCIQLFRERLSN